MRPGTVTTRLAVVMLIAAACSTCANPATTAPGSEASAGNLEEESPGAPALLRP